MKTKFWMTVKLIAVFVIASPLLLTLLDSAVSHYNNKKIQEAVAKEISKSYSQNAKGGGLSQ